MSKQRILIVDDDSDLREALDTAFSNAGFVTTTAVNGAEGLKLALSQKPDLILLDITMPIMNGHQMLHELRKDTWGKTVHVILLTNSDDPANITQGFGLKGDGYIIKSNVSLDSIVKKVTQHFAGYHH